MEQTLDNSSLAVLLFLRILILLEGLILNNKYTLDIRSLSQSSISASKVMLQFPHNDAFISQATAHSDELHFLRDND